MSHRRDGMSSSMSSSALSESSAMDAEEGGGGGEDADEEESGVIHPMESRGGGLETPVTAYSVPPMVSPGSVESTASIETVRPINPSTSVSTGISLFISTDHTDIVVRDNSSQSPP